MEQQDSLLGRDHLHDVTVVSVQTGCAYVRFPFIYHHLLCTLCSSTLDLLNAGLRRDLELSLLFQKIHIYKISSSPFVTPLPSLLSELVLAPDLLAPPPSSFYLCLFLYPSQSFIFCIVLSLKPSSIAPPSPSLPVYLSPPSLAGEPM